MVFKHSKIWSGFFILDSKPDFVLIPDLGSRIQGSKRHRISDPDPQHCKQANRYPRTENLLPDNIWQIGGRYLLHNHLCLSCDFELVRALLAEYEYGQFHEIRSWYFHLPHKQLRIHRLKIITVGIFRLRTLYLYECCGVKWDNLLRH